ncbi:hypothetical protein ACFPYJ_03440 [Paenibacillus solisilvae]|uniref:Fumarate reductase/succinate dehydrogenase flavoprotein-like C-terminal domain-containing protein n=1 Tax=Paenibacillus solisilvae TaxID=2486751 RepID=A0ABW0VT98_9BACL
MIVTGMPHGGDAAELSVQAGKAFIEQDCIHTSEAAALAATANWMYAPALVRRESRNQHAIADYTLADTAQQYRFIVTRLEHALKFRKEKDRYEHQTTVSK